MSSDSDEFYDFEETTANDPDLSTTVLTEQSAVVDRTTFYSPDVTMEMRGDADAAVVAGAAAASAEGVAGVKTKDVFKEPSRPRPSSLGDIELKVNTIEKRRQKLEDLRKRMLADDDEGTCNVSPPNSHPSSVEGIYASNKAPHPFKIIDYETVSLQSTVSLGRVGRVLGSEMKHMSRPGSKENVSRATTPEVKVAPIIKTPTEATPTEVVVCEPDIVASAKASIQTDHTTLIEEVKKELTPGPVAPPRRRKNKGKAPSPAQSDNTSSKTVECLTKDLEYSLDLSSATQGSYVIKPQDEESTRAERRSSVSDSSSRSSCEKSSQLPPSQVSKDPASSGKEDGTIHTLNMIVRTRTDSGKPLTDLEILEQVSVLNLDTGEQVPLSMAEDKLPQCLNPLSLHIMRLTSEYVSNSSLDKDKESDCESVDSKKTQLECASDGDSISLRKKTSSQLKKFLGSTVRKTVGKAKMMAHEVSQHARQKEEIFDIPDELTGGEQHVKMKASSGHKGPYEFDTLQCVQEMHGEHLGPIWCMKFSPCGRLLATAGQDRILRIWVLKKAFNYFQDMRSRCNADNKASPTPSQESLVSQHSAEDPLAGLAESESDPRSPFVERPFCIYSAHTSDVLDVSWSKNYFILSSSMDKTVRLWHISRKECLCCFQHIDFVTAIAFHPRDDRYFLSGSLDGKLRLWNIPDKKVALWNELDGQTKLITAANFCQNGKFAVVGSYDGRCVFYTTEHLKYYTQIHVRSTRGKNSKGRKISGIESLPNEDKILVTSNDSRIRLYDLRDLNLSCKYKGYVNNSSQIRASFSHDGKYIISGSENQYIYMWKTHHDYAKFSSARRDRNDYWEAIKAHNAVVTSAVFAPDSNSLIEHIEKQRREKEDAASASVTSSVSIGDSLGASLGAVSGSNGGSLKRADVTSSGYVLVSADFNGCIKVFVNRVKPKHSSLPVSALS